MTWQLDAHQLLHRAAALRRLAARYETEAARELRASERQQMRDAALAARELADDLDLSPSHPTPTRGSQELANRSRTTA